MLIPSANWTTSRALQLGYNGALDTGPFITTLNGSLFGASQLAKVGSGRLVINDGAQFTGPLAINSGTVQLNTPLGDGGTITVNSGARLEGNSVFNRPIAVNGTLAPGGAIAIGMLETGNMTLQDNSTLHLNLISSAAFDQVRVDGAVILNGLVQLSLTIGPEPFGSGVSFPVLLNDGFEAIVTSSTRAFAIGGNVLDENETFIAGTQEFRITYAGGDGNDVYLSAPEPSAGAMIVAASVTLAFFGRKRERRS